MSRRITELSDAELIAAVRAGDTEAVGKLYERHFSAARSLAHKMTGSVMDAEDVASEVLLKVWSALRRGRGPSKSFRAYLLTAVRHRVYEMSRDKTSTVDDITGLVEAQDARTPFVDNLIARTDRELAREAYDRLPPRWQRVLRYTELEDLSPADVAPLLGLTANGVAAVAFRAREGLKQQYLRAHLAEPVAGQCETVTEKLAAWTRRKLTSDRQAHQVAAHLEQCGACQARAAELAHVNAEVDQVQRTAA